MNILIICLIVMVAVILALQALNVAISQKAVNIVFCIVLLLILLSNSGWVTGVK